MPAHLLYCFHGLIALLRLKNDFNFFCWPIIGVVEELRSPSARTLAEQ
jgi:hypothetical protein